jgi:hypothetical protein
MISSPQSSANESLSNANEIAPELPPLSSSAEVEGAAGEAVNYEESPLIELEIEGTDYRLDAGRAGTALCISTRPSGSWSWVFRGEARWQAKVLRCKAFDRTVLMELSSALAAAAADTE